DGELAIVLHTHQPYVAGFGTWPFGEEWLWESLVTSYLPLLELLNAGAPLTLSLTPVLCDQLEEPGALERCAEFLATIRVESHRRDIASARADGDAGVVAALEHSAARYDWARGRLAELGGGLLGALRRHAAWTSAATHAVLPLLATSAGVRLQLRAGIDAHRRRAWGNDGAPYDPARAAEAAREHGADFVARVRERLAGGGLCVVAVDTELLGDWWHEGPQWLAAVVDEAARQGLTIARLDDAL